MLIIEIGTYKRSHIRFSISRMYLNARLTRARARVVLNWFYEQLSEYIIINIYIVIYYVAFIGTSK